MVVNAAALGIDGSDQVNFAVRAGGRRQPPADILASL